ncbi:MAG: rRNA maturation RNase YbeY [Spirochaetales bacterium]
MKVPELEVFLDGVEAPWIEAYHQFLLQALEAVGARDHEVSVTLCTDPVIRALNRQWRGKDEATDVLSFEADPEVDPLALSPESRAPRSQGCYGDLVISMDTLHANSAYFSVNWEEELKRVSVHGFLHLMGWDHASNEESEPMLRLQERLLLDFKERKF